MVAIYYTNKNIKKFKSVTRNGIPLRSNKLARFPWAPAPPLPSILLNIMVLIVSDDIPLAAAPGLPAVWASDPTTTHIKHNAIATFIL